MKKIFLISVAITIILLSGITFIPELFHKDIQRIVTEQLDQRVDAPVSFDHLGVSLWKEFPHLTISLTQFYIGNKEFDEDTLLSAPEAFCSIEIIDYIFGRHIQLVKLWAISPKVNIWQARSGKNNFSIFNYDSTQQDNSSDIMVHFPLVEVENASFYYTDALEGTHINLEGFNFSGRGKIARQVFELKAKLDIRNASLSVFDKNYFKNKSLDLEMDILHDLANNTLLIRQSNMAVSNLKFNLNGNVNVLPRGYNVDLVFDAPQAGFSEVLSVISFFKENMQGINTTGNVELEGFAKGFYVPGTDTIPQFAIKLLVDSATYKVDTLANSIQDIRFNFEVSNHRGHIDSTMFDIDSLHLRINDHILYGNAHLHGLAMAKIDAHVEGTLHLDELLEVQPVPGLEAEGEISFEFIVNGRYQSIDQPLHIPHIEFHIDVEHGKLKYQGLPDSLSNINFHSKGYSPEGNWENMEISIQQLKMDVGDNPIEAKLLWKGLQQPDLDVEIRTSIQLEDLKNVIPVADYDMKGTLTVDVTAKGVFDPDQNLFPVINAGFCVEDGYLKSDSYPEPIKDIHLKANLTNSTGRMESSQLRIEYLNYTLDGDQFQANGTIKDFKNYDYDFNVKGLIDLAKLTRIYPLRNLNITGTVQPDFTLSGTITDLEAGRYDQTKANGTLLMKDIRLSGGSLPVPISVDSALFLLSPEIITLQYLSMRSGKSTASLVGELFNYFAIFKNDGDLVRANLKLVSDTLDLNDWKPWFTQSENIDSSIPAEAVGSSAWRIPANIDFDFDSDLGYVKYEDMDMTQVVGEIRIKDGIMTITETGFNSLNAVFRIGGVYNSRDYDHPHFDISLDIKDLDIQRAYRELQLIQKFAPAASGTEGLFSIDYKISGQLDQEMNPIIETIRGGGILHIDSAKINGMKVFQKLSKKAKKDEINDPHLKNFNLESTIENSQLFVKPFSVKISGFQTEIEGVTNVNGYINYLVKVDLFIKGIKIPFRVTGHYSDPKVTIGKGKRSLVDSLMVN